MKCPFCNTEIEDGSLYCNHCGSAMQIVPDFNVLEDDVLPSMLDSTKKRVAPEEKKEIEKHINKRWIIMLSICVVLVLLAVFGGFLYTHSYNYYTNQGNLAYKNKDYTSAISFYNKALDKKADYSVYISLGKAQQASKYYEEAEASYLKAYELNPKNENVILLLCMLYEKMGNYSSLDEMLEWDLTDEQEEIVNQYGIPGPQFSLKGGTYNDDIELVLSGKDGFFIYYTLDGTEPSVHNGTLYEDAISITKQGTTIVNAVCIDISGKTGVVATETYEITYVAPEEASLSPTGGRLTRETYITITSPTEDASIYYTWDGSMPTTNSYKYTEPILVPEGNNVLSVIVVDKHGMTS
nr:chitobiase/beta-hexosaminidase C-terminal domain-containing protein [Lachnospiraceae bacterium]